MKVIKICRKQQEKKVCYQNKSRVLLNGHHFEHFFLFEMSAAMW